MLLFKNKAAVATCLLMIVTAGCIGPLGGTEGDKSLTVTKIDQAPADATVVPLDNETVQRSDTLVDAVETAARSEENELVAVNSDGEETALDVVSELPGGKRLYIRTGNTTVLVQVVVEE